MAQSQTIKNEHPIARSYVDQLILSKLTELKQVVKISEIADQLKDKGIELSTIRALLASNSSRFAYSERRWIPAARLESQGRSLHTTVRLLVSQFGGPMPIHLLVSELSHSRENTDEELENILKRLAENDSLFLLTQNNEIALSNWFFVATDETIKDAFEINGIQFEEVEALSNKLQDITWKGPDDLKNALAQTAPVNLKLLGAAAWLKLNPQSSQAILLYDWKAFASQLLNLKGYVYSSDGMLYPEQETDHWIDQTNKFADKIVPTIEIEDVAPVELRPEDIESMINKIISSDQTLTATKLLEELFEVTPAVKTFPDDLANIINAIKDEPRVWWVGGDRFRSPNSAPDFVQSIPEPLVYRPTEFKDEDGDFIDFEISDDGLSSSLRKLLTHPLAMDVLDETIMPIPKGDADQVRLVIKPTHRELGTFPLCQFPTGWLSAEPEIQEIIFCDEKGRKLQIWANVKERLLFNLIDWWYEQPIESGAVFTLTRTPQKNVFDFHWMDQPDPVVHITPQRMEQLREIQAHSQEMSNYEILKEVLTHWPKGSDFLTILWEANVVRRMSRRAVASILSSYQCFYQRSGSPVWHYDPKKVELGVDKTKKKFIVK